MNVLCKIRPLLRASGNDINLLLLHFKQFIHILRLYHSCVKRTLKSVANTELVCQGLVF